MTTSIIQVEKHKGVNNLSKFMQLVNDFSDCKVHIIFIIPWRSFSLGMEEVTNGNCLFGWLFCIGCYAYGLGEMDMSRLR